MIAEPRRLALLCISIIVLLAVASSVQAQYEPPFFTARRAFMKALDESPAGVAQMIDITAGYSEHRSWLQHEWAGKLLATSRGIADRERKLQACLDAFDESLAGGDTGRKSAVTFCRLHEELLGRKTPPEQVDKAAAAFHDRLSTIPQVKRDLFKGFGHEFRAVYAELRDREIEAAKSAPPDDVP
jgi:hypothetical protein